MDELNDREHPQSRIKKDPSTFSYIAIAIVIVFVVSFYFYIQKTPSSSFVENTGSMLQFTRHSLLIKPLLNHQVSLQQRKMNRQIKVGTI